jgi:hypothetical protein
MAILGYVAKPTFFRHEAMKLKCVIGGGMAQKEDDKKEEAQEGLDKFVSERISKCDYWRTQLREVQRIIMQLSVDIEQAEAEAREARRQHSLRVLKSFFLFFSLGI